MISNSDAILRALEEAFPDAPLLPPEGSERPKNTFFSPRSIG
ncbi:MAG: hypothetical protein VXV97_06210 [Pseudomonadota bacterium]|nr:hypothetical protein [Pseudomonadota bacterium]